ncbi:hypothetical protein BGZ96_003860 [Linnemannia gamsii]|uniref:Adhesin domain-containing protein n=1 Tax=Linnemannia gamsii TaxID=64522 RepID=A0ABQ7K859_9FUNG|nr:hypothetical protein BGZ96_003860 [Linnemannia gamsii]
MRMIAVKRFFDHYKGHLLAAVVSILVIWGLISLVSHLSYECEIPEDAEVTTMEYSFDPADYRELFFHLDEGIIRAALARNCTRVEVDIIFPRRMLDYDLIQLESNYAGNVQVRMDPKGAGTAVVDKLEIFARSGSVSVKDLVVSEAMNVLTKDNKGQVEVQVQAGKVVRVQAENDVVLDLESHTNMLDVKVTTSSNAQVTMTTSHFSSHPEFFATPCCFYQQKRDNHTLVGYMSYNGYEPGYYPRIDVKGYQARLDLL